MTPITAVIVHFGDISPTVRLADCLAGYSGVEVVVVANDRSPRPKVVAPSIMWLVPDRNLGYGDAFNLVVRSFHRRYYVVLNTDVFLPEATLRRCLEVLAIDRVGVVGPVLRHRDGSLQSGAAQLTRLRRHPRVLHDPGARTVDCAWVTGAVMFIDGRVARDVGMDGSYFLGAEDADLCIRAGRRGWRVMCCGDVDAVHDGGKIITGTGWIYYTIRNRVWRARANYGQVAAIACWFSALSSLPRIIVSDLVKRRHLLGLRLSLLALAHALKRKPDRSEGSLSTEPLASKILHTWRQVDNTTIRPAQHHGSS